MGKRAKGELERAAIEILWDRGALSPGEVHDLLSAQAPIAYTTVMTVLVRMWRKGWLERERTGRAFSYRPVESREEHAALRMGEVLSAAKDRQVTLSYFVADLSSRDQDRLRALLAERKRPG
ncbi:MAG: BlaI/MecI/CopY family transcriptional regulator [Acidimicrobiales bacterium]